MLYSTYAIYASGKDAVLGGMIVMAIALHRLRLPRAALLVAEAGMPAAARGLMRRPAIDRRGAIMHSCISSRAGIVARLPSRCHAGARSGAARLRRRQARWSESRLRASSRSATAPTRVRSPTRTNPATRPATRSRCAGRSPTR